MQAFVNPDSIVRQIWGKSDTILFIFGGAAAEFALNKAVDWLYFTGKLPGDPIGRLFSTVVYAQRIVFADLESAHKAIDQIAAIHDAVERSRASKIPDWAYRDVLYMLIHYSQTAFELLERKMIPQEKQDLYDVFYRVGERMGLKDLPTNYDEWLISREQHLNEDLIKSIHTIDLFKQYKKHLGSFRYFILIESQKLVVPQQVRLLLNFNQFHLFTILIPIYKFIRQLGLSNLLKALLLPSNYKKQIFALDSVPN